MRQINPLYCELWWALSTNWRRMFAHNVEVSNICGKLWHWFRFSISLVNIILPLRIMVNCLNGRKENCLLTVQNVFSVGTFCADHIALIQGYTVKNRTLYLVDISMYSCSNSWQLFLKSWNITYFIWTIGYRLSTWYNVLFFTV